MSQHSFRVKHDGAMAAVTLTDIGEGELADEIRELVAQEFGD